MEFQHGVLCTWQVPWLAVEKPWSVPAWPFLSSLTQTGIDKAPLPLKGLHSDTASSFQFSVSVLECAVCVPVFENVSVGICDCILASSRCKSASALSGKVSSVLCVLNS